MRLGDRSRSLQLRLVSTTFLSGLVALGVPLAAGVVGVGGASTAQAQDYTTGVLNGTVTNDAGKPVSGASVSVTNSQGVTRTATADAEGKFQIPTLSFGAYTATVTASGFTTVTNPVSVGPQGSAYTFSLPAAGASSSEVVVTGRARRTSDFSRTDTGIVVDVPDLSSRVPLGRNVTAIVQLAPSVSIPDASINASARRNQTLSSVGGSSASETVYYINGLNVTDQRTFLGFADLPFDSISSVDVKTGGFQAEFGRATGGVVNIVTKSGNNEYHAGASIFYTPDALRSTPPNAYGAAGTGTVGSRTYNDTSSASLLDYDTYLSGPILKDHIFFFGILNVRDSRATGAASVPIQSTTNLNPTAAGSIGTSHYDTPRWLTKFDFNITDKQKIEATIFSDAQKTASRSYAYDRTTGRGAFSSEIDSKAGGLDQIYKYTGVFTDWFTLSAQYGQVRNQYSDLSAQANIPRVRDLTVAGVTNYLTSARTAFFTDNPAQDVRESERVDGDFFFNLFGKHHVRLGYDREALNSSDNTILNGGGAYDFYRATSSTRPLSGSSATFAPAGTLYVRQLFYASGGSFKAEQDAYYLQDSWELTPRLNLELGVRNDTYNYKIGGGAQSFIKLKDQYAPRVGATYDVFGNRQDKLYASFGRYYLPIAENTAIREAGANPYYYRYYNTPSVSVNANGQPTLGAVISPDVIFGSSAPPDYRTVASQTIKPQYKDEFIVGYEHVFRELPFLNGAFNNSRVGVRYVYRELGETIEDTDLGYAVDNYCAQNAIASCSGGNAGLYQGAYTLLNPGKSARVFLDLVNGPGSGQGQYINLTAAQLGLPSAKNIYNSVEFTFERPFDGKWSIGGSYVLSLSRGNYEGGVDSDIGQTDTSITQDFDNRYFELGQTGRLPNNHTHTIKVFGSYSPIDGLSIGGDIMAQSGRQFGCLGYDTDDPNYSPSPSQRFCPLGAGGAIILVPRGSRYETDWVTNVDLNLSYKLPVPARFGAPVLRVDVFNLFNSFTATRVVEQGVISGDPNTLSPTYLLNRSYQAPRSVRFGLTYAF